MRSMGELVVMWATYFPRRNWSMIPKSLSPKPRSVANRYNSLEVVARGNATPACSAAATASAKSLSISLVPKPPSYWLAAGDMEPPSSSATAGCGLFT